MTGYGKKGLNLESGQIVKGEPVFCPKGLDIVCERKGQEALQNLGPQQVEG